MFKYDSVHGNYRGFVESAPGELIVDGHHIQSYSEKFVTASLSRILKNEALNA